MYCEMKKEKRRKKKKLDLHMTRALLSVTVKKRQMKKIARWGLIDKRPEVNSEKTMFCKKHCFF